jgi:hypothetical protein
MEFLRVSQKTTEKTAANTAALRSERGKVLRVPLKDAEDLRILSESLLDTAINVACTRLIEGATREARIDAWNEFAGLIRQRSPEHVARLEQEKWERVYSAGRR